MAKIDLEKLICSLAKRKYFSEEKLQDALKEQDLEYKDGEIVEIQKPKFKVGDWIINRTDDTIMQIINNTDFYETIKIGGQRETHTYNYTEWNFRLWTIEDAKNGDVLQLGEVTAIFKEYIGNGYCKCYCSICEGEFEILIEEAGDNIFGCINTTPATKEQRKLLFQEMKKAGYEWDADKKELKKIRKPLYKAGNIIGYKSHYYYIKKVVKNEEKGFHYNLIAIDGGEVISIGPAGEKDIILISNNRFDYEHANIQQKDFAPKASFADRQLYNRVILKLLSNYVEKYPDIRFGQMLCNLGIKPYFDEESKETYWNLSKTINKKS